MADKRYGNQTPTQSFILPYTKTKGPKAISIYKESKHKAQPWQEQLVYDILAVDEEGKWKHQKFGYEVPRRNGKGEILTIRELYGIRNGEKVLHTAHRADTSSAAAYRLAKRLEESGYKEILRPKAGTKYTKAFTFSKQGGKEKIVLLDTRGSVSFRTRTEKGGLGEGYDLLIIDEAQEYTRNMQNTLQYVVSDSENGQIILCGTPPTAVSSGTIFQELRNTVLSGESESTGWAEWSVESESDVNDEEIWYRCNPAMGYQLTVRDIRAEDKKDVIDYNIQRYGLWLTYNQKSEISENEWMSLKCKVIPKLQKRIFVGIKYSSDGSQVAMSVAVKTTDGKIFVECIDCQPSRRGNDWIISYLRDMKATQIVIDGASGQNILAKELKNEKIKNTSLPTVKEVIVANSIFERGVEAKTLCHNAQPSLVQVASNCTKRAIGSNGGFGFKSLKAEIEISLLDSIILAFWAASVSKERRKQKISY